MLTTIDGAGRIVVPKALRDAMRLSPGQAIEIILRDGRLEVEVVATPVDVRDGDLPRVVPRGHLPPLTDELVREALEGTRR